VVTSYDKIHNRFKLNNRSYRYEELKSLACEQITDGSPFEKLIGHFLIDWLDNKDYIIVNTSGSTGKPKAIKLQKEAMVHSASATGDFFNLKPGDKALHCLSTEYIAGKMMLVRAIVLGLELDFIEPRSQLIFNDNKDYDFCALVPLQLDQTKALCNNIKTIIVGGAPISNSLKASIQNMRSHVYETYGMTETITHIAVKKLNNFQNTSGQVEKALFKTLPKISISLDDRNCLMIKAPNLNKNTIITNDLVKLHTDSDFEWLGRHDNIINTGGVKVLPEQIEAKLSSLISNRFFISKQADNKLGECVILVLESDSDILNSSIFMGLSKFEIPKMIYSVEHFIVAPNGKILRQETLNSIK